MSHEADFDVVYRHHAGAVLRLVRRRVRSKAVAEDIAQTVWLEFFVALRNHQVDGHKVWNVLYTLLVRRVCDHWRSIYGKTGQRRRVLYWPDLDRMVDPNTTGEPLTQEEWLEGLTHHQRVLALSELNGRPP